MSDELGEVTPCWTITFRRYSKHPPARLWKAITDSDDMARWMIYPARIDLRVGGEYFVDFSRTSSDDLEGRIVRVEKERVLAYVWGRSYIEWTIEPDGGGCRYTFVSHGQDSPVKGDDWTNEGVAAGWHGGLVALDAYLDGVPLDEAARTAAWQDVMASYRERIEAVLRNAEPRS